MKTGDLVTYRSAADISSRRHVYAPDKSVGIVLDDCVYAPGLNLQQLVRVFFPSAAAHPIRILRATSLKVLNRY